MWLPAASWNTLDNVKAPTSPLGPALRGNVLDVAAKKNICHEHPLPDLRRGLSSRQPSSNEPQGREGRGRAMGTKGPLHPLAGAQAKGVPAQHGGCLKKMDR